MLMSHRERDQNTACVVVVGENCSQNLLKRALDRPKKAAVKQLLLNSI